MRKLYFTVCACATPHMGVLLDSILEDKEKGHEIHWAYCSGVFKSCFKNPKGNSAICKFCQCEYKELIKEYSNGITLHPITKKADYRSCQYKYNSVADIKNIVYRDVYVGFSILSLYISLTRKMQFEITDDMRYSFDSIISQVCNFVDQLYDFVEMIDFDTISIYNGRYYENRLFYDVAMKKGIVFESYEIVGGFGEPCYKACFKNGLPHDTKLFAQNANYVWNVSKDSNKEQVGRSFFEKRRNGMPAADKVYITKQVADLLPSQVSTSNRNIVIFNSSDDELAALGGEWEKNKLFSSQYDAIEFMLANSSTNIHFYLRIHPNLGTIYHSFVTDLYKLKEYYTNITIIEPNSPISTYALMDIAEKVVVFGSTMGVESCYWGKPVILIGHAFYTYLDIAYQPKTHEEFVDMIHDEHLMSKNNIDSIKYAYYILDRKYRTTPCSHIDINFDIVKFCGREIKIASYLKLCNSKVLFKFAYIMTTRILRMFSKNAYTFGLD